MRMSLSLVFAAAVLATCGSTFVPLAHGVTLEDGPRLSSPRATHALVRTASGQLLAIGGCVVDGCDPGPNSASIDILAADGKSLLGRGSLLARRVMPSAAALPDGRVLVLGGWIDGRPTRMTEIFDPATGRSRRGPDLAVASGGTVVTLADTRVLVVDEAGAEIYDPASESFSPTGRLKTPRGGATGTLLPDGRVLIAGGSVGAGAGRPVLANADLFDPRTGTFTPVGPLAQGRHKHAAVALPGGDVLVLGGADARDYEGKLRSVERFVVAERRFVPAGQLATPRFKIGDGVLRIGPGTVLVAAGAARPELFDVARGRGELLATDLGGTWNFTTLASVGEHRALLVGGYSERRIEVTDRSWIFGF